MGTRSDIHALIDALADEELDAVRAVLNAVRAEDGFESLSENDLESLRDILTLAMERLVKIHEHATTARSLLILWAPSPVTGATLELTHTESTRAKPLRNSEN